MSPVQLVGIAAGAVIAMIVFVVVAVALFTLARRGLALVRRRLFGHRPAVSG